MVKFKKAKFKTHLCLSISSFSLSTPLPSLAWVGSPCTFCATELYSGLLVCSDSLAGSLSACLTFLNVITE